MRNFRTEGIIVRRNNIGEADRILTVFTPTYGKISIKAAGVRKITSKRGAHIELLNRTILGLYKGTGMHVLTEAKMVDDFSSIKNDFFKIGKAYYLCELVDSLCPENQENHGVYVLLQKALEHLSMDLDDTSFFQNPYQEIEEYTIGTFGLELAEKGNLYGVSIPKHHDEFLLNFELSLLTSLGYWEKGKMPSKTFDVSELIESIIERRLKTRQIFAKI